MGKNETIFTMITELDKDGNASLSFDEFLELMAGKEGKDEKDSREEIEKVFRLFDLESKGHISVRDVARVSRELGERLSMDEITEIVRRACLDESTLEIAGGLLHLHDQEDLPVSQRGLHCRATRRRQLSGEADLSASSARGYRSEFATQKRSGVECTAYARHIVGLRSGPAAAVIAAWTRMERR